MERYGQSLNVWRVVRILCKPGFEDIVSGIIFESGFSGLEETFEDRNVIFTAFYRLFPEIESPVDCLSKALEKRTLALGNSLACVIDEKDVPERDWETLWRQGLKAIEVGSGIVIRPSWVDYFNPDGRIEIIIDPKMAFGTGGHETTRLCLEILERMDVGKKSVLDAGCGSGVLSIAAAKLGAARVVGFDNDSDSVENARENVTINGVEDRIVIEKADLTHYEPGRFSIVFANIISSILIRSLGRFQTFLEPGGRVVFSGLLSDEETLFICHLENKGFAVIDVSRLNEWIAVTVKANV